VICNRPASRLFLRNPRLCFLGLALLLHALAIAQAPPPRHPHRFGAVAAPIQYRGWDAYILGNGRVEVVAVPALGRVVVFRFSRESNVFREPPKSAGKPGAEGGFGGSWGFAVSPDQTPPSSGPSPVSMKATSDGRSLELDAEPDPATGIRVRRRIELDPAQPVMTITTVCEKVSGGPVKSSAAAATALRVPQRMFLVSPPGSIFPNGTTRLAFDDPSGLKASAGLVSFAPGNKSLLGSDAETMLWMDDTYVLRIDAARAAGDFANRGSSLVLSTGPDGVQVETYSPLATLKPGDTRELKTTYTLARRSEADPEAEARKIVGK
jgi:hypothetical protein